MNISLFLKEKDMKIIEDIPLYSIRQDKLNRGQLVDYVFKTLMASTEDNHTCRCIGIYGKWGEGKSSFMNLIKERLGERVTNTDDKEKTDAELKVVLQDFNPWLANNHDTLIWDFFNTISKDTSTKIKNMLAQYSGMVNGGTNIVEAASEAAIWILPSPSITLWGKTISYLAKQFRKVWNSGTQILSSLGNKTLSERKKEISDSFKDSGHHRFIFIDDIDRLDKEEIHTVFRLIREVADFYNVTYIIAMDPDIVAKSLSAYFGEGNICDGRDFIDKIIQVPIQLPMVQQSTIKELLKEKFKDLWISYRCGTEEDLDKLSQDLSHILLTQRQIIRYINQISFVIPALEGEVNMQDLCKIEAIKVVNVQAYLTIANSRTALFKESNNVELVINEETSKRRVQKRYEDTLNGIVKDINSPSKEYIREMVDDLFQPNLINDQNDLDEKRLCTGIYFAKYFLQAVPENVISDRQIQNANIILREKDLDGLVSYFNEWYHSYGEMEMRRAILSIIHKYKEVSDRSKVCQTLVRTVMHSDLVYEYKGALIDDSNDFTVFIAVVLFKSYVRKESDPYYGTDVDFESIYNFLSIVYTDTKVPITFLIDLHAFICREYNPKSYNFAKALVNRFKVMTYEEQQGYLRFQLLPVYQAWAETDRASLESYLKDALDSPSFNPHKFLTCLNVERNSVYNVHDFVSIFGKAGIDFCKKLKDKGLVTDVDRRIIQTIISSAGTMDYNESSSPS